MITHGHKQIKKHLPTFLHLHLHSPTPLECRSAPDNQSKIVRTELAVVLWSICVCVSGAGQDCAAVYSGLEALFAESEAFEFGEFVAFAGAAVTIFSQLNTKREGCRKKGTYYMAVSFNIVLPSAWWRYAASFESSPSTSITSSSNDHVSRRLLCTSRG